MGHDNDFDQPEPTQAELRAMMRDELAAKAEAIDKLGAELTAAEARAEKAEDELVRMRGGVEAERQYQLKTAELFADMAMPNAEKVARDNAAALAAILEGASVP